MYLASPPPPPPPPPPPQPPSPSIYPHHFLFKYKNTTHTNPSLSYWLSGASGAQSVLQPISQSIIEFEETFRKQNFGKEIEEGKKKQNQTLLHCKDLVTLDLEKSILL